MTEAWALVMSLALAAAVVCGALWILRTWRRWRARRAQTVPEMAARSLHWLGRELIALADLLDSAIIGWRDIRRERRPIRIRAEIDRELRKMGRSLEAWKP